MAELPRNGEPDAHPQPLRADRPLARLLSQVPPVADHASGTGQQGPDPGRHEVELVRDSRMAMTDPLGDMLTRIRNGQQARKDCDPDAGVEAARPRARCAPARRLYPRLFRRRACRPEGPAHRAQIFRGPAGDPASGARVEARPPGLFRLRGSCRASATALARSSCRPRAACCRTPKRATRMSAAKCWRRCSDVPHR